MKYEKIDKAIELNKMVFKTPVFIRFWIMTNKKLIQSLIFQNRLKQYFVSEFESRGDGPRDSGL